MTALAWLAPWLFGAALWALAAGWPRRHFAWCATLGGGWIAGALAIGALVWMATPWVSPQSTVRWLGPWLAIAAAGLWWLAWRWRGADVTQPVTPTTWPWRLAGIAVLALLVVRGLWLWRGATLPPLFPWDALAAWSVRPATWFQLDRWVPFVDQAQWLAHSDTALYTMPAVGYPTWLGYLEVWYAAGAGCWCAPAFTRLWPALWAALLVLVYGQLRVLRVRTSVAIVAAGVLGSLPLVDVHAALAGYADLWLGALVATGMLAWMGWYRGGRAGAGLLATAIFVALPAVKLEGLLWTVLALATMGLGLLPRRRAVAVVVLAFVAAGLAIGIGVGGWHLPVPGGHLFVDAAGLHYPGRTALTLGWQPVAEPVLYSLFIASSWNLLFYAAVVWIPLRARHAVDGVGLVGLMLATAFASLFALFFFTSASAWAQSFTASSRLFLQGVPLLVAYLALLTLRVEPRVDGAARS